MVARRTGWLAAGWLAVFVVLAAGIGSYPLLEPDEGRNAEVAREMAESNDYVLPQLNGLPYLDKPVLYFAAGALAIEVFGPRAFAVRLPSLVFTLGMLIAVAWLGRAMFDRQAGWIAAFATAATPFTIAYARTVIFDAALACWMVIAVAGFYRAIEHPRADARDAGWGWRALAWGAMALGVLTKGPIAVAIPLLVALPYAAWRRRLRAVVDLTAVFVFLAVALPWVLAVSRRVPEFLEYALVTETARRLTTPELQRTGPLWYFLVIFPAAALPWSAVALAAVFRRRDPSKPRAPTDHRFVFLATWMIVPLLFFSLSQSKRPQYVLPLIPAVGLFVAGAWRAWSGRLRGLGAGAAALALLGLFLVAVRGRIAGWVPASAAVGDAIPPTALAVGATCLAGAAVAWLGRRRVPLAVLGLALPVMAIPLAGHALVRAIAHDRSSWDLAQAIQRGAPPAAEVIGVEAFPLSLPFYLGRTVTLATDDASELTSNYLLRHAERWRRAPDSTLRDAGWWREALVSCTRPRVFVARVDDDATRRHLEASLDVLAATRKYVAYGPCGTSRLARGAGTPAE